MDVEVERLREHVATLARRPRPAESRELELARRYVTDCLRATSWQVAPHEFRGLPDEGPRLAGVNLIATHAAYPLSSKPRICIGAHLDSRPNTPGADDNASAVATLLELARCLSSDWPNDPQLDLELVVFDLEENGMLGAAEHVGRIRGQTADLRGMVSLEMLGYCDHRPNTQALPRSLVGLYPTTGDFIAVIGNQNSTRLIESFRHGLERVDGLPVESLEVPSNGEFLQATRLSDHSPFWDAGYPALMITDTSFLRNPHYHLSSDTPDTLDMEFLRRVPQGCVEAVGQIVTSGL